MESGSELRKKAEEEMIIEIEKLREENWKLKGQVKLNRMKTCWVVYFFLTLVCFSGWCLIGECSFREIYTDFALALGFSILVFYPGWRQIRKDLLKEHPND